MKTDEYRAMFAASPCPMWVLDAETGAFLDINPSAIRSYGYSRDEFPALKIDRLQPVSVHRRKDGSEFFAESSAVEIEFWGRRALLVTAIDVTARVEAEERLSGAEARFRALFEMVPDAAALVRDGAHVLVNAAYAQLFGYGSPREMEGLPAPAVFAPGGQPAIAGHAARQARGLRKDGSQFEMEVRVSETSDDRGRCSVFVMRDVSALLRANEDLERQRRRLAEAQRLASLGNWEVDLATGERLWSDEVFRILGLDAARSAASSALFYQCVHPDDADAVRRAVERALRDRNGFEIEHRVLRPDGSIRWVQARGEVVSDGDRLRFAGAVLDITTRRESEERLRLLESVVVCGQDAVMICAVDPAPRVLYVNPAFTRIYQYSPEEVIGNSPAMLRGPKTDLALVDRIWEDIEAGRHGSAELVFYRKDGSDYLAELMYQPFNEPAGQSAHVAFLARDVTERRKLEAQFRQSQKMEAVGRLAGGVAHDFNNLLLIIAGYAHMLREGFPVSDPRMEAIEQISKAADRAAALTRQLLVFSRRQDVRRQVVDVNALVANLEKMLHRVIGEDIELRIRVAEQEALVRTDANQIDQVLMNLAVNARDAMPEGGVLSIGVDTMPLESEPHYGISGPMVRITVSDTGIGMDPATLSRIFEPFFTTKGEGAGTGLGLPTVYAIVKQNEGEIFVESTPGQGTTFEILLPAAGKDEDQAQPAKPGAAPGGTETILLTEDDAGVRKLIAAMLRRGGYTVIEAASPGQALDLLNGPSQIHLLLTDVVMPGMTGWTLATSALKLRPDLRVIHMSGYTDHAAVHDDSAQQGKILRKPFTMEVLHEAVRQALTASRVAGRA